MYDRASTNLAPVIIFVDLFTEIEDSDKDEVRHRGGICAEELKHGAEWCTGADVLGTDALGADVLGWGVLVVVAGHSDVLLSERVTPEICVVTLGVGLTSMSR